MESTLRKWGNSIGLRIPAGLLSELRLSENSAVDLSVEDGRLIVSPRQRTRKWKYSLEELLEGVTTENVHTETDWGAQSEKEIW